jgi:hypothetical protein
MCRELDCCCIVKEPERLFQVSANNCRVCSECRDGRRWPDHGEGGIGRTAIPAIVLRGKDTTWDWRCRASKRKSCMCDSVFIPAHFRSQSVYAAG